MTTIPLNVSASHITLTLDILSQGGSVRVGVHSARSSAFLPGLSPVDCINITANTTNGLVVFYSGKTLDDQLGNKLSLVLEVQNAMVYTLGFA